MHFRKPGQLITAVIFSLYFLYYLHAATDWHFLDNFNLIIHEAGHPIFSILGHFMGILGGSLFQVLVPSMFVYYFYNRAEYFSASLLLFWLGQNLINVSIYAGDAALMNLPLLGGDAVDHDWNTILGELGLLNHTALIANSIYSLGVGIIILAIISSLTTSQSES